jgi:hypothetical protein
LIFEYGTSTDGASTKLPLRMRVSMSAMGSVIMGGYQLAFFKPGIRPSCAMFRRQMRQMPNFR